jgi:glycosyltransferase involved in cell wall biosynthesis
MEAVSSVLGQSFGDWEAIVVDDCSTDSTWKWLSEINDSRVRAVRLDAPSERSTARNRGLQEARGEFALFLDDDDKLTPWALQYLWDWAERRPDVVVVVGAKLDFDNRGHQRRVPHPHLPIHRSHWWEEVVLGWWPISGQCLVRSAAIRDAGGWDRTLTVSEDRELWMRLSRVGGAMLAPRVVLQNRAHVGQWRPTDVSAVDEELRKRVLRGAGTKPTIVLRMTAAAALGNRAAMEHAQGNWSVALSFYLKAIWAYPRILSSPIIGPMFGRNIGKMAVAALLGRRAVGAAKQWKIVIRTLLKRDPGGAREVRLLPVCGEYQSDA